LKKIIIQAINVSGLGSVNWVQNFLYSYKNHFSNNISEFYLNEKIILNDNHDYKIIKKINNNFFYKLYFYLKIILTINKDTCLFSLSDLPVPFVKNQILFVNQANLISPVINKYSSKSIIFIIKRLYFRIFIQKLNRIFVQSVHMKKCLIKTYRIQSNYINILNIPIQPTKERYTKKKESIIRLLYPANHYSYKNHKIITDMLSDNSIKNLLIYFTATISEFQKFKNFKSIRRIDYYSYKNTYKIYNKFDGLIYPSRIESLGLPLQEALNFKIPILCSDLPYSRELLKEYGYYFDQESKTSLRNTILYFMKYTKRNIRFNKKL
jgi:glycosyltransferase involved in cell wall biosynthesis